MMIVWREPKACCVVDFVTFGFYILFKSWWLCTITGVLGFIVQFRPKILGGLNSQVERRAK
jgi:hypothetical protein